MSICKPCASAKTKEWYAKNRERVLAKYHPRARSPLSPVSCKGCAKTFTPKSHKAIYCEKSCGDRARMRTEAGRIKNRHKNNRRRDINRHTDLSAADIRQLLASRTYCSMPGCGKRMTDHEGPRRKHLDHIIPNAIGGTWTRGNVRVICRTCNLARPKDGSDLNGHQPTLWAEDAAAAAAVVVLKAERAKRRREPTYDELRARGRKLVQQIKSDLAYCYRINGASWQQVADTFGMASAGAAHNLVHTPWNPRADSPRLRQPRRDAQVSIFKHKAGG